MRIRETVLGKYFADSHSHASKCGGFHSKGSSRQISSKVQIFGSLRNENGTNNWWESPLAVSNCLNEGDDDGGFVESVETLRGVDREAMEMKTCISCPPGRS